MVVAWPWVITAARVTGRAMGSSGCNVGEDGIEVVGSGVGFGVVAGDEVEEELAVPGGAGMPRGAGPQDDRAELRGLGCDPPQHRRVHLRIADDSTSRLVPAGFELRLDQR